MIGAIASGIRPEIYPENLVFTEVGSSPFEPTLFRNDDLNILSETFTSDTGQFSTSGDGTFSLDTGKGKIIHTSGGSRITGVRIGTPTITMTQFAISMEVSQLTVDSGSPASFNVALGIVRDTTHYVIAVYDHIAGGLRISSNNGGSSVPGGQITPGIITPPFKLGFGLAGRRVDCWTDIGSGWTPRTGGVAFDGLKSINYAADGWKPGIICSSPGGVTFRVDDFTVGRFGGMAWRDPHVVTDELGRPYVDGNSVYITMATAGYTGGGSAVVWKLNLSTYEFTQVAVHMYVDSVSSGVEPHFSHHVIRLGPTSWRILYGTWGRSGTSISNVEMRLKDVSSVDLLSGTHLITEGTQLTLSGGSVGNWDPWLVRDPNTGIYYLLHTDNFLTRLDSSNNLSSWANVWNAGSSQEGTTMYRHNRTWGCLAGQNSAFKLYDFDGTPRSNLQATADGQGNTLPWPCIFRVGRKTYLVTFDGQRHGSLDDFTWGRIHVHEANGLK